MSLGCNTVLQIVPQLPGTSDGVGDYALNLARALSADHGITTTFLIARKTSATAKDGYEVISGLNFAASAELAQKCEHVILHYANYGYQARGVPFSLRAFAKQLRSQLRGRWVTTFHEFSASGPPWKSAFWLRPLQLRIAGDIIDVSTACFVSNIPIESAIHDHDPGKKVRILPVLSNFGEPERSSFEDASPKRWAICGGTALVARSVALFEQLHQLIPDGFAPQHLDVIGGRKEASVQATLDRLSRNLGLVCSYHPDVSPECASDTLRQSSFGWMDYFGAGKVWPSMLLKSTAFAAFCAHGIVPILSHREEPITIEGEALPGPFYITPEAINFPSPAQLRETQRKVYGWYHAHAHSRQLARVYAEALT